MSIPSTPIDKLLAELGAPDYASIEIWRPTAQGSAVHAVAIENVERSEVDPAYGARFVGAGVEKERLLSPYDYGRLAMAGAKEIKPPTRA